MRLVIHWARYFTDLLPDNIRGLVFVLDNGCDEPFTYQIDGGMVTPLGHGDLHSTKFDHSMRTASFETVDRMEPRRVCSLVTTNANIQSGSISRKPSKMNTTVIHQF